MDTPNIKPLIDRLHHSSTIPTCREATLGLLNYLGEHLPEILSDHRKIMVLTDSFREALMEPSTDPSHSGNFPNQTYTKLLFSIIYYIETNQLPDDFLENSEIFFTAILEESDITGIIPVGRPRNQGKIANLNGRYGLSLDTANISNSHIVFLLQKYKLAKE
jgi:hypothetical protein